MSKLLVIAIIFISVFSKSWCQNLVIDELNVSHFKINKNPNIFIEDENDGPFIRISFTIDNNTKEDIFLNTVSNNLMVIFNYNGERLTEEMIWETEEGLGSLKIPSGSSKEFTTSSYLFLGTSLWEEKKYDYTMELLKVLPTLRLKYSDGNLKLISTVINNVIIKK